MAPVLLQDLSLQCCCCRCYSQSLRDFIRLISSLMGFKSLKSTPNRMCEWLLQAVYDRMQQRVFSDTTAVLRFAEALANEASAKYPDCVPASYHVPYGYEPGSGQMPLQIGPKHWCVRMRMYEIRTNQTDAAS